MKTLESILIAFTSYSDYRFYAEILCQLNRNCKCHHVPVSASLYQLFSGPGHLSLVAALFEGQPAIPIFDDIIMKLRGDVPTALIPVGLIVNPDEFAYTSYQMQGKKVRLIKKSDKASHFKREFAEFLIPSSESSILPRPGCISPNEITDPK